MDAVTSKPKLRVVSGDTRTKPRKGEVVQIRPSLKVAWLEAMAVDIRISPTQFRVAALIGLHINRRSEKTFISEAMLARLAGRCKRTIEKSITDLELFGWLIVERNDLGTITKAGVRASGGRGNANVYRLAFNRETITAVTSASKVAKYCDVLLRGTSQPVAPNIATGCDPTPYSSCRREPTWGFDQLNEKDQKLAQSAAARLRLQLGKDKFISWFERFHVEDITPPIVKLVAPSKFVKKHVDQHFATSLLAAWKSVVSTVSEVRISAQIRSGGGTFKDQSADS